MLTVGLGTYTGLTATGVDVTGQSWLALRDALVASGLYEQAGAGDGLAATTTGTTNIFTAGVGYKTSGSWGTGLANSFSNPGAWFRLRAKSLAGVATGFEYQVQRGSGTALGNDRFLIVAFSDSGFSGSPSATNPYTSGTTQFLYGSTAWNGAGVNVNAAGTSYLGGSSTATIDIHYPSAESDGDHAPPWSLRTEVTSVALSNGSHFFVEKLIRCSASETKPYVVAAGTIANMAGSTSIASIPTTFGTSGQGMYTLDASGTVRLCAFQRPNTPDNTPRPGSATPVTPEAGSSYPLERLIVWVATGAGSQPKGACESLRQVFPPNANYMSRATFFAAVAHASESPWFSWGHILAPWAVGVSAGSSSPGNRTDVRDMDPPAPAPDATAPVFGSFTPAAGAIAYDQSITLPLTDNLSELSHAFLWAEFGDTYELIWDGSAQADGYTVTFNAGVFAIARTGGWRGPFTLKGKAWDQDDNASAEASAAYTISTDPNPAADDSSIPTLELVSPLTGVFEKLTPLVVDVDDDRGLKLFVLYGVYEIPGQVASGYAEVIYDGDFPDMDTLYTVTGPTVVGGKQRYSIVRKGGWPPIRIRLRGKVIDTSGNSSDD